MPKAPVDLTGTRHFRSTVLYVERVGARGGRYWRLRCDCGAEHVRSEGELLNRIGRSCGKCDEAKPSKPITKDLREQARARGEPSYDPGIPCKHGHVARRFVKNNRCVECCRICVRNWEEANPDRYKEIQNYHWEKRRENSAELEKMRLQSASWRMKNVDRRRELARIFYANNKSKVRAWNRRREQLLRILEWADPSLMEAFYVEADRLTALTGIKHEVDHIIPLNGANVCGLHVPWNLQVITKALNAGKRNRWRQEDGIAKRAVSS